MPVEERRKNWQEVNLGFTEEQAIRAARRCLNCCIYSIHPAYEAEARQDDLRKAA